MYHLVVLLGDQIVEGAGLAHELKRARIEARDDRVTAAARGRNVVSIDGRWLPSAHRCDGSNCTRGTHVIRILPASHPRTTQSVMSRSHEVLHILSHHACMHCTQATDIAMPGIIMLRGQQSGGSSRPVSVLYCMCTANNVRDTAGGGTLHFVAQGTLEGGGSDSLWTVPAHAGKTPSATVQQ